MLRTPDEITSASAKFCSRPRGLRLRKFGDSVTHVLTCKSHAATRENKKYNQDWGLFWQKRT